MTNGESKSAMRGVELAEIYWCQRKEMTKGYWAVSIQDTCGDWFHFYNLRELYDFLMDRVWWE